LLVVDVSEPIDEIHEKLVTCHDTLYERNEAPIVTVLNKIDLVNEDELAEKRAALSALAPDPVAVSAHEGTNVDALLDRIDAELPDWQRERLVLPMTEDTMSLVSWIHDNAHVEDVTYGDDDVVVAFEARPAVVSQARSRASDLQPASPESA
jgi:GTP-binding protein HflX